MELVILIFLGIFWCLYKLRAPVYLLYRKATQTIDVDEFRRRVVDEKLERELYQRISDKDPEIIREYDEIVAEHPGVAFPLLINSNTCVKILMANRGKFPKLDAYHGYYPVYRFMKQNYKYSNKEECEAIDKVIDQMLRRKTGFGAHSSDEDRDTQNRYYIYKHF